MSTINRVILIGNLGKEPEIRSMPNAKQVASFSLATSETWRDKNSGEQVNKTEWHNIVVFNEGLINVIKNYLHKGTKIYLEGAIQNRKWTDSNNIERYITEIVLGPYNSMLRIISQPGAGGSIAGGYDNSASSTSGADSMFEPENKQERSESNNDRYTTKKFKENLSKIENDDLDDEIPF